MATESHVNVVIERLSKTAGGATIETVVAATDMAKNNVSSRLAQRVRHGTLHRVKGVPTRFFRTAELAAAFLAQQAPRPPARQPTALSFTQRMRKHRGQAALDAIYVVE